MIRYNYINLYLLIDFKYYLFVNNSNMSFWKIFNKLKYY